MSIKAANLPSKTHFVISYTEKKVYFSSNSDFHCFNSKILPQKICLAIEFCSGIKVLFAKKILLKLAHNMWWFGFFTMIILCPKCQIVTVEDLFFQICLLESCLVNEIFCLIHKIEVQNWTQLQMYNINQLWSSILYMCYSQSVHFSKRIPLLVKVYLH